MGKHQDLTGKKFGRLSVIREYGQTRQGFYQWLCKCDCGNTIISVTGQLNSGGTQSCGCIQKEQLVKRSKTHGMSKTKIYKCWLSMKRRCDNDNCNEYVNYGKRGISYDPKWKTFEGFYEDMGESFKEGLTIERLDVDGDYKKSNCTWIPKEKQASNTRRTRLVTYQGKTDTLSNMARKYGFTPQQFQGRLKKGWTIEEALTIPIGTRRKS